MLDHWQNIPAVLHYGIWDPHINGDIEALELMCTKKCAAIGYVTKDGIPVIRTS